MKKKSNLRAKHIKGYHLVIYVCNILSRYFDKWFRFDILKVTSGHFNVFLYLYLSDLPILPNLGRFISVLGSLLTLLTIN